MGFFGRAFGRFRKKKPKFTQTDLEATAKLQRAIDEGGIRVPEAQQPKGIDPALREQYSKNPRIQALAAEQQAKKEFRERVMALSKHQGISIGAAQKMVRQGQTGGEAELRKQLIKEGNAPGQADKEILLRREQQKKK